MAKRLWTTADTRRAMKNERRLEQEAQSMVGEVLPCSKCGNSQICVRVIPANHRHADPTEMYELACGHVTM